MKYLSKHILTIGLILSSTGSTLAATEIQLWHSMEAELGKEVNTLADRFNKTNPDYKIVPVYKGNYEQGLAAGIAATRSGNPPAILQVYEVGTATMMASKVIKPVWQLFQQQGIDVAQYRFIPAIMGYYTDDSGKLLSLPFNSSIPVLYYNKPAFIKAGLDPNTPPSTWQKLEQAASKLKKSGITCPFTTGWQSWIQLEEFSAWHALPVATDNNGFSGQDAKLLINQPAQIKHITFLQQMNKDGNFIYYGRKDEPTAKFYSGDCAMVMASSASLADIKHQASFPFGVGMMPYDQTIKGAPQNGMIGGASLWVMQGKDEATYRGVAKFFNFLSSPDIVAEWHQKTGYLPINYPGYQLSQQHGFYLQHAESEVAIKQMLKKPPLPYTKGLRLGYMPQIRTVMDEELENVWTGKKTPEQALDSMVQRGDVLLKRFQQQVK